MWSWSTVLKKNCKEVEQNGGRGLHYRDCLQTPISTASHKLNCPDSSQGSWWRDLDSWFENKKGNIEESREEQVEHIKFFLALSSTVCRETPQLLHSEGTLELELMRDSLWWNREPDRTQQSYCPQTGMYRLSFWTNHVWVAKILPSLSLKLLGKKRARATYQWEAGQASELYFGILCYTLILWYPRASLLLPVLRV